MMNIHLLHRGHGHSEDYMYQYEVKACIYQGKNTQVPIPIWGDKGVSPHQQAILQAPLACPTIQLSSDTINLEITPHPTG